MSYQAPHTAVRQNFETTPPAVSIENLPTALIGTAYEVHKDEVLLSYDGIDNLNSAGSAVGNDATLVPWVVDGSNKVIYSASQGKKIYDFYPPLFKAIDENNGGTYELDSVGTPSASGLLVNHFDTYTVGSVESTIKAYVPFFISASVTSISDKRIECSDGRFIDAKLVSGLRVIDHLKRVVGYIDYVESNTVLHLKSNAAYTTGTSLYFGSAVYGNPSAIVTSKASYLYDPEFNFVRAGIRIGDVIDATIVSGSITASIVSIVSDNLVEIYSGADPEAANYTSAAASKPVTISKVYSSDDGDSVTFTDMVSAYDVKRFIGFTEKYDAKTTADGAITCTISGTTLTLNGTPETVDDVAYNLQAGDKVVVDGVVYTIVSGSAASYVLDISGAEAGGTAILMFKASDAATQIKNDIIADYRAVMVANTGTVFSSADNTLIGSSGVFGVASVYNELAFMIQIVNGVNGGRVLYAGAVDPTVNIVTAYSEMLEELKFYDVYSHALGTTEAGVNALLPSYVDEQSEPYEAHERIAVQAFNQDDVYLLGYGASSLATTGVVSVTGGSVNLTTIGLGIGDVVSFEDDAGDAVDAIVVSTPTATEVTVDLTGETITSRTFYYYAGTKSKQANKIKSLPVGNRRVTVVWPGMFRADTTAAGDVQALTSVELPPYFISALVAGLDGGQKVSQSFTNLKVAIPGLSNIELGTNSYFRKADMDNIAGSGVDIFIQDSRRTNTIYSRHDLTSNMDAIEYRERSITKQADQSAKTYRNSVNPYVGKYNISDNLLIFIRQVVSIAAKSLIKDGVVAATEVLEVKRDPDIADKINILVKVTVFVAGNYFDITLNIVSR